MLRSGAFFPPVLSDRWWYLLFIPMRSCEGQITWEYELAPGYQPCSIFYPPMQWLHFTVFVCKACSKRWGGYKWETSQLSISGCFCAFNSSLIPSLKQWPDSWCFCCVLWLEIVKWEANSQWENVILNEAEQPWSMLLTLCVNFFLWMFVCFHFYWN